MMLPPLELWGGHECTVNRVGDVRRDQTVLSGHQDRIEDLAMFADLGIDALRYPVLWERTAPSASVAPDFGWEDARLAEIVRLGMRPIVGLLHHGAGPDYTSLVDPAFPEKFAAYAAGVARRYPWVREWTPINEPLTTARFSALYGFWHPHARDERQFWMALLNQIDGIRLAMHAIRAERPDALLVQTEDLGFTHASPRCAGQALFENTRRWLTWDLLAGRVTETHPMFFRAAAHGFADRLRAIADDPSPADVVGVNHYLSSERYLDESADRYPEPLRGGNGQVAYADIEAVRVCDARGVQALIEEAASRYGARVAVTECHNGCTREEQIRWFNETWRGSLAARERGADVCAVTAWALLGSTDWPSLLTRDEGRYEPGVFDVRGRYVRPTAMATLLRQLAKGAHADHPVLEQPGWWRRADRFIHARAPRARVSGRPVLITGRSGTLGRAFARACEARGLPFVLTGRDVLDVTDPRSVAQALDLIQPWAVVNAAGYVRVDAAESDRANCFAANASAPEILASACARRGLPMATFSSDLVFSGALLRAYVESDATAPLNVYGRSKAAAERCVQAVHPGALIVRTAAFFSPLDPHNFADAALRTFAAGRPVRAASDVFVSPTFVPDLVSSTLDLVIDGEGGLWHLANAGRRSWAQFAADLADAAGYPGGLVEACSGAEAGWIAARPANGALSSERAQLLPSVESAIERMASAWLHARAAA